MPTMYNDQVMKNYYSFRTAIPPADILAVRVCDGHPCFFFFFFFFFSHPGFCVFFLLLCGRVCGCLWCGAAVVAPISIVMNYVSKPYALSPKPEAFFFFFFVSPSRQVMIFFSVRGGHWVCAMCAGGRHIVTCQWTSGRSVH